MVPILVILTLIVFVLVDLALRKTLKAIERKKIQKKREEALASGLRLDFTDFACKLFIAHNRCSTFAKCVFRGKFC